MTAVYTGSFDPVTRGHIDIARRSARLCDHLTVVLLDNPGKQPLFTVEERAGFLRHELADIANLSVDTTGDMLAKYIKEHNIGMIVRGIRNAADLEYETIMACHNRLLADGADTVFLAADALLSHISCSSVKETARLVFGNQFNQDALLTMVTPKIVYALKQRLEG